MLAKGVGPDASDLAARYLGDRLGFVTPQAFNPPMLAHVQLAVLVLGALACLVQLFGGLFDSSREVFHAAPIALLALIPVAFMPRTQAASIAAWSLAFIFTGSWLYEHQDPGSRFNAFDVLEWAMLVVALRTFHQRTTSIAA